MENLEISKLEQMPKVDAFIAETNMRVDELAGLIVQDFENLPSVNKDIRELEKREKILKKAEQALINLVGINRAGKAIDASREVRLALSRSVKKFKESNKQQAIDTYVEVVGAIFDDLELCKKYLKLENKGQWLIEAEQALKGKKGDLTNEIQAHIALKGNRLHDAETDLTMRQKIMNEYDASLIIDDYHLMVEVSFDDLAQLLDARLDAKINRERQLQAEAEARAKAQAQPQAQQQQQAQPQAQVADEGLVPVLQNLKCSIVLNDDALSEAAARFNFDWHNVKASVMPPFDLLLNLKNKKVVAKMQKGFLLINDDSVGYGGDLVQEIPDAFEILNDEECDARALDYGYFCRD